MRISTSMIYDAGVSGIQNTQASELDTYNQIATGRRVLTPSDDPVAAAQALVVQQSQSVTANYATNQGNAQDRLTLEETQLQSAGDTIQAVLDKLVQAGNTSLSDVNRASIAQELQIRLDEMVSIANSQDGSGHYIFSGYQSDTRPFSVNNVTGPYSNTNPYVSYNGDQGTITLQVDASRQMAVSDNGASVFMRIQDGNGNVISQSVFDTLKNAIDTLNTPVANNAAAAAALPTKVSDAINQLHDALNTVVQVRTSVGARRSELDSLSTATSAVNLQYKTTLSNLQDLDYADAISSLSKQQVQLQAAQKAFVTVSSLSLFKLI